MTERYYLLIFHSNLRRTEDGVNKDDVDVVTMMRTIASSFLSDHYRA
jgi:hypothetical protein